MEHISEDIVVVLASLISVLIWVGVKSTRTDAWHCPDVAFVILPEVHRVLTERKLESLKCAEVASLLASGEAVMLDIRDVKSFTEVVHSVSPSFSTVAEHMYARGRLMSFSTGAGSCGRCLQCTALSADTRR